MTDQARAAGEPNGTRESVEEARSALVRRVLDEQRDWREVVAEVGQERMLEPGPMGDWSFRDLAAHLLGWRERTIAILEAAGAGRPVPADPWPDDFGSDDGVNDWIQAQYAGRSAEEVLRDTDLSYDRLAAALGALPDELLTSPNGVPGFEGYPVLETDWLSHWHDEHEESVRDWLASRDAADAAAGERGA